MALDYLVNDEEKPGKPFRLALGELLPAEGPPDSLGGEGVPPLPGNAETGQHPTPVQADAPLPKSSAGLDPEAG